MIVKIINLILRIINLTKKPMEEISHPEEIIIKEVVPSNPLPLSTPPPIIIDNTPIPANPTVTPSERLHNAALLSYGKDASPNDIAPDELGCMESVDEVYRKAFGHYINGRSLLVSTYEGLKAIKASPTRFKRIYEYEVGCIILCATGTSTIRNTPVSNGHIGIITKNRRILSNSSSTGKFSDAYTIDSWNAYYGKKGGYPVYIFLPV